MKYFSQYWDLYKYFCGSSSIREDERFFIDSTLEILEGTYKIRLNTLCDVGCGDGRISNYISSLRRFNELILIDSSNSVEIAAKRLGKKVKTIKIVQEDILKCSFILPQGSLLISIGLINYFPNQKQILDRLLSFSPSAIYLGVTGFSLKGNFYKSTNLIRGRFLDHILDFFFLYFIKKKEYIKSFSRNTVTKKLVVFFIKAIEPLVSRKIYRLTHANYVNYFLSNNYSLVSSQELGLCNWMLFVKTY